MTSEPRRIRSDRRGRGTVHETRPGETLATRCGFVVSHGVPTTDPVTCRTCLGDREWRGRRSLKARGPARQMAPDRSALRLTDVALGRLEELNAVAYEAWIDGLSSPQSRHWSTPKAPPEVFPPPPPAIAALVVELQFRYERRVHRRALRSTATAHDELLRLQSYLLPGAQEAASCPT